MNDKRLPPIVIPPARPNQHAPAKKDESKSQSLAESLPVPVVELILQVKRFVKTCGGLDQAEKIVESLPPMPSGELLEFIRALRN